MMGKKKMAMKRGGKPVKLAKGGGMMATWRRFNGKEKTSHEKTWRRNDGKEKINKCQA